jgi:hypothetical protein
MNGTTCEHQVPLFIVNGCNEEITQHAYQEESWADILDLLLPLLTLLLSPRSLATLPPVDIHTLCLTLLCPTLLENLPDSTMKTPGWYSARIICITECNTTWQQFLHSAYRVHLCVLQGYQKKWQLLPYTTLTDQFLHPRHSISCMVLAKPLNITQVYVSKWSVNVYIIELSVAQNTTSNDRITSE